MFNRSGCTNAVLDFINSNLIRGVNFMKEKPCKVKILQNLNIFLKRLDYVVVSPLTKETLEEIKRLKKHILNNCLSGIPPGFGTERNEQLHKLLNRSLLSGATRINVELVVAILAVLFYHHNSRTLLTKHKCNPRVGCALPIEEALEYHTLQEDGLISDVNSSNYQQDTTVVAGEIEDVHTEFVSRRNFGLEIEEVVADGDCAFRNLVKQIYKLIAGNTLFKEHLESISLLKTEEKDTYHLGQLFVDEVLSGEEELELPKEDDVETLQEKAEEFQSPGVYDKMRGDLVMKTSAQILQLPTMMDEAQ
ncbi:uncharacterized protein LOC113671092 [Pocillopora damicornis]|uniref:uncharacterized protein LOC113671092 n=1 Tax=Pocillopora damicornis TaxID=46731 RepID=UPI000F5545AB|nr:uncharacterized protein LOC113671092 [Pocillopora damicornis]